MRVGLTFCLLMLASFARASTPADAEAFLDAARRTYPTAAWVDGTNTLVTAYKVSGTDFADRPVPGGRIRWHRVDGMRNVRDIGGWNGLPAGRVFRGSEPDCQPVEKTGEKKYHNLNVTAEGLRTMRETLGIRTDLDLRGPGECPHPETSALGVPLIRVPLGAYMGAFSGTNQYAQALRVFADARNYPIYFHCWGGADRTGTIAYLLEGLCGVDETDLAVDYELTSFTGLFGVRRRDRTAQFPQFVAKLKTYPGATTAERIAAYMETTLGLSKEEIASIRRNLLGNGARVFQPVQPFRAQAKGRPILVVNGDNDHYFKRGCMRNFVPVEARVASAEGARRYLDALAAGGKVTHYFACAVGQRASYDSKACDPMWLAIDEAKARGEKPDEWPVNVKKMHDNGFDCYQVWCEYGRKKGISVWISQRMNDVHHVDRTWNMRTNRFWYEHPELHRAPDHDRAKGGLWTLHALDYSKPEVREFEFGIFRELVDRYDADGFELDFMRFWEHLTPGKEREQAPILTAFIRRCRAYANEKAKTRGHAILLSTRVPTDYAAARAFGFDPETWAREGLVDMIAIANFWAGVDFDFGFADWQAKIAAANPSVTVLPCACDNLSCSGAPAAIDGAGLAGWADNAYAVGADGIYFFNAAYYPDAVQRTIYECGFDAEVARSGARRYLPAFHDCVPKGVSDGRQLPLSIAKGGMVRIVVGTAPCKTVCSPQMGHGFSNPCEVVVVLDADVAPPRLTLNGMEPTGVPVREGRLNLFARDPRRMKSAWRIPFAAPTARAGTNIVSFASTSSSANILWCEIAVAR